MPDTNYLKNLDFIKPVSSFLRHGCRKGEWNMGEDDFRKLIKKFVERDLLKPQMAEKLLQRILKILFQKDKKDDG